MLDAMQRTQLGLTTEEFQTRITKAAQSQETKQKHTALGFRIIYGLLQKTNINKYMEQFSAYTNQRNELVMKK